MSKNNLFFCLFPSSPNKTKRKWGDREGRTQSTLWDMSIPQKDIFRDDVRIKASLDLM